MSENCQRKQINAMFISDLHLGMKTIRVEQLIDFLNCYDAKTIYLVGDIVDGWRLQKAWRWPVVYNDFFKKLLEMASNGTRIVLLPGNHDEFLRRYEGVHFGGIEVVDRIVHEGADGKSYLVIHGDQFDVVVLHAKWLAHVGDWAYNAALRLNIGVNFVRRTFGFGYWSLSAWAKNKVKNAVSFIGQYETALAHEAKECGVDGVICGHIHHADMHDLYGTRYINTGDWVESCTAIVEHAEGEFELVRWTEMGEPKRKSRSKKTEQAA